MFVRLFSSFKFALGAMLLSACQSSKERRKPGEVRRVEEEGKDDIGQVKITVEQRGRKVETRAAKGQRLGMQLAR